MTMSRLDPSEPRPLCLADGCALNIKWNSMIRASGLFTDVWVPPFTNDSDAAIGTALCELLSLGGAPELEWGRLLRAGAYYRPVAPICLESAASTVFNPGGADPYMLFDHRMRPGWAQRVLAVVHLDGTARLQTIRPDAAHTRAGRVVEQYHRISGIPLRATRAPTWRARLLPRRRQGQHVGPHAVRVVRRHLYTDERRTHSG